MLQTLLRSSLVLSAFAAGALILSGANAEASAQRAPAPDEGHEALSAAPNAPLTPYASPAKGGKGNSDDSGQGNDGNDDGGNSDDSGTGGDSGSSGDSTTGGDGGSPGDASSGDGDADGFTGVGGFIGDGDGEDGDADDDDSDAFDSFANDAVPGVAFGALFAFSRAGAGPEAPGLAPLASLTCAVASWVARSASRPVQWEHSQPLFPVCWRGPNLTMI